MKEKVFKGLYYSLIFFFFVALDFCLTNIYKNIKKIKIGDLRIEHPIFHHDLKPNSEGGGYISEKYFTNSLGFRDFAIRDISIKTEKKRILLMGDSFTLGAKTEYIDTYAGKIVNYFEKKNIEVLNGAVTSYSPIIYFTKIKFLIEKKKLEFDELYLFIDISDTFDDVYRYKINSEGNVVNSNQRIKKKEFINSLKRYISLNFTFFFIILDSINDFFSPDLPNDKFAINHQNNLWHITEDAYELYGKKGLAINTKYLDKLKKILDNNDIKMKIFIYPWPGTLYHYKGKTIYEKTWENWATENNVFLYNYVEKFSFIKDLNLNEEERLKIINSNFYKLDMHFNKKGHLSFYNEIKNFLDK